MPSFVLLTTKLLVNLTPEQLRSHHQPWPLLLLKTLLLMTAPTRWADFHPAWEQDALQAVPKLSVLLESKMLSSMTILSVPPALA